MQFYVGHATLGELASVIVIDVVLAGDNAIVVGMAASGLAPGLRRRVIAAGIVAATLLRVALSSVAMQLLAIVGLTIAGGILLLWVAWKSYRELSPGHSNMAQAADIVPKTFAQALFRVVVADLSMSLDNVLAVAGAARDNLFVLLAGLLLSVALMGAASALVARLMGRYRWIGWVGLVIVTFVALRLIYDGSIEFADKVLGVAIPWL